ncbi:MAG: glycosyltransferase family 4 protein [Opitutae bacterium]|nr:glycosyltransferase family 4 protein [Opitutae bacterium]
MATYDLAIDCRLRASTGIGRYVRELAPRVAAAQPDWRVLLVGPDLGDPWVRERWGGNVAVLPSTAPVFRWEEQALLRAVAAQTRVLWCPHFCVPWRMPPTAQLAVTVHDLIPLHVVRGWKGRVRRLGASFYLRAARRQARCVLTEAHAVARELVDELGFSPERIRTAPLGVTPEWFAPPGPTPEVVRDAPYVLYVGNLSPHKNVEALLRAFARCAAAHTHRLVLVGEKCGFTGHADFARLTAMLGERVILLSRLADAEIRGLFAGAQLLVQPSLEEGFGLPPLEAMAAGCPVLTSDCATLVETAGEGAHRFRLDRPDDLTTQLQRLLTDESLRLGKVAAGRAWAGRFTWERTAAAVAAALAECREASP